MSDHIQIRILSQYTLGFTNSMLKIVVRSFLLGFSGYLHIQNLNFTCGHEMLYRLCHEEYENK